MANLQLDASQVPTVYGRTQLRVVVKKTWADAWKPAHYLQSLSHTVCAAPSLPVARFRYEAGRIKREDKNAFVTYTPLELLDWFIRIEVVQSGWETEPLDKPLPVWTGIVAADARAPGGTDSGNNLLDQTLTAYGMEYLLDRREINSAFVLDEAAETPAAYEIDRCLVFNERYIRGFDEKGNRSLERLPASEEESDAVGPYVFDRFRSTGGTQLWNIRDILDYLLHYYAPASVRFMLRGPDDVLACLARIIPGPISVAGKTLRHVLDDLIDRQSGLGWRVRVGTTVEGEGDDQQVVEICEIVVFTHLDQPITIGDATVPANADRLEIPLDEFRHLVGDVEQERDAAQRYGKIIVLGGYVVSCGTFSITDGTLAAGWNEKEEDDYKLAGGSGTDGRANDAARNAEQFGRVYTTYTVPREWNGLCGGGAPDSPSGSAPPKKPAVPQVEPKTGKLLPNNVTKIRTWGLRFGRNLPLTRTAPDTGYGDLNYEPEYRDMLAAVLDKGPANSDDAAKWVMLDNAPDDDCRTGVVRPLDTAFGVEVRTSPAYLLARNHFKSSDTPAAEEGTETAAKTDPKYDYKDLVVTAAFETDQRLRIEQAIPGGDPDRVLTIEQPDLQLWHVVPGTVVDVQDGKLIRHTEASAVRDDSDRARQILALAVAWYGRLRTPLTFRADYYCYYDIGQYVIKTTSAAGQTPVNCVITQVVYDDVADTSTITTAFGELDVTAGGKRSKRGLN
jgi:hypothetical protein